MWKIIYVVISYDENNEYIIEEEEDEEGEEEEEEREERETDRQTDRQTDRDRDIVQEVIINTRTWLYYLDTVNGSSPKKKKKEKGKIPTRTN